MKLVSDLLDGQHFVIPSLSDVMTNLEVCYVTETGTTIQGKKKDSVNSEWKPFRCQISNSTKVESLDKFSTPKKELDFMAKDSDELSPIPLERTEKPLERVAQEKEGQDSEDKPKQRGRPKVTKNYNIPSGEFLVTDFAQLNSINSQVATLYLNEEIAKNVIVICGKKKHGGRGRPFNVYIKVK